MNQPLTYLAPTQWVPASSTYRFPAITLRDEIGAVIPSSQMTTMTLSVYLVQPPTNPYVGSLRAVNVKNDGVRGLINSSGVFTLTLTAADNLMVDAARAYEQRRALVEYTWASGAKTDSLELTYILRRVPHRGEGPGDGLGVQETVTIEIV